LTDTRETFRHIFHTNRWRNEESISGPGSTMNATRLIRAALPAVLARLNIRTIVDAPCGDGAWMRLLDYEFDDYLGVDIVPEIIEPLQKEATSTRRYMLGDIVADVLPTADAVFCRDCLVHLTYELGLRAVANFRKAGFRYVFLTTYPGLENRDIPLGRWRRLNMEGPPFNFPPPLALISERRPGHEDVKSMGVWRAADLPVTA
jgi:SAM-dependent methyltransferase